MAEDDLLRRRERRPWKRWELDETDRPKSKTSKREKEIQILDCLNQKAGDVWMCNRITILGIPLSRHTATPYGSSPNKGSYWPEVLQTTP